MLAIGTILEWNHPLRVINPLPVPIESSDKKSLILDPMYVNTYILYLLSCPLAYPLHLCF